MKFTIEMPDVATCGVGRCAYNVEGACHARAITVGDGLHPGCDTFTLSERHTDGNGEVDVAGVGACKVAVCKYNRDLECEARSIEVDTDGDQAACVTFEMS